MAPVAPHSGIFNAAVEMRARAHAQGFGLNGATAFQGQGAQSGKERTSFPVPDTIGVGQHVSYRRPAHQRLGEVAVRDRSMSFLNISWSCRQW